MPKLTVDDLKKIKDKHLAETNLREGKNRARITVHMGTCGIDAGAREIMTAVTEAVASGGDTDIIITNSGCAGLCSKEPMMTVEIKDGIPIKYVQLDADKVKRIYEEHVKGGKVVEDFALVAGHESSY